MEKIQLSETLVVSRVIQGLMRLDKWNFTSGQTLQWVEERIDLGITTFDEADIYGDYTSEKLLGDALEINPSKRHLMQIITKCGIQKKSTKFPNRKVKHYDTSKEHIIYSVNQSLKNLKTDYIDLLLIHRPDPLMNPIEVSEAFNYLYKTGKVLNFGVSNFKPSQFDMLQKYLKFPLLTNQIQISPTYLDNFHNGTIDQLLEYEIPPMAWSPLGGGALFNSNDERSINVCQKLEEIAKRYEINTIDEVIYAWLYAHPVNILPIVGSKRSDRVELAIKAIDIHLSREDWFEIYVAALGKDVD